MCGIAGFLTDSLAPDSARCILQSMNDAQRHRGPDGEGTWDDTHAYLGHRRLAIIDLSECGRQPMTNEDGSLVLVCNGEIYNFRELRADLIARGHRFSSQTDIEVILHLYEEHGDDCITHLVGMFAFGLWDTRRHRLVLGRDRIGEKPLFYTRTPRGLAFASEVPALLNFPGVDRRLDDEALVATLIYQATPAPLSMFAGVRAVPPAALVTLEGGRLELRRYWAGDCSEAHRFRGDETEAIEQLDALFGRAVKGALIADVPVGVLLSGGVDSSGIAYHAARAGADVSAYSVAYDSPEHPDPDLARARQVSQRLRLRHREIPFSAVDLTSLPRILEKYA